MSVIFKKFDEKVEILGPFRDLDELQTASIKVLKTLNCEDVMNYYLEFTDQNKSIQLNSEEAFKIFEKVNSKSTVTINIWPNSLKKIDNCGSLIFQQDSTTPQIPHTTFPSSIVIEQIDLPSTRNIDEPYSKPSIIEESKLDDKPSLGDILTTTQKDPPKSNDATPKTPNEKSDDCTPSDKQSSFASLQKVEVKNVNTIDFKAKLAAKKSPSANSAISNTSKKTPLPSEILGIVEKKHEESIFKPVETPKPQELQIETKPEIKSEPIVLPDDKLSTSNSSPTKELVKRVQPPSKMDANEARAKIMAKKEALMNSKLAEQNKAEKKDSNDLSEPVTPTPITPIIQNTKIEQSNSVPTGSASRKASSENPTQEFFIPVVKPVSKAAESESIAKVKAKQQALRESQSSKSEKSPILTPKKPEFKSNLNQSQFSNTLSRSDSQNQSQIMSESLQSRADSILNKSKLTELTPGSSEAPSPKQTVPTVLEKRNSVRFADNPVIESVNEASTYFNQVSTTAMTTNFKLLRKEKSLRVQTEEAHERLAHRHNYFEEKTPLRFPDSTEAIPEYPDSHTESPRSRMESSQKLEHSGGSLNQINLLRAPSFEASPQAAQNNNTNNNLLLQIPKDGLKNLMMEIFFENMGVMAEHLSNKMNGGVPPVPILKRQGSSHLSFKPTVSASTTAVSVEQQALELCQQLNEKILMLAPEQRKMINAWLGGVPEKIQNLVAVPKEEEMFKKSDLKESLGKKVSLRKSNVPSMTALPDFYFEIEEKPCGVATADILEFQKTILITNTGTTLFPADLVFRPVKAEHGTIKKIKQLEPNKSVAVVLSLNLPRIAGLFLTEWEFAVPQGQVGTSLVFSLNIEPS